MFCKTPDHFKEHDCYGPTFSCFEELRIPTKVSETYTHHKLFIDYVRSDWDRHTMFSTDGFVEVLEESMEWAKKNPGFSSNKETLFWMERGFDDALIERLKEEILEKNLGSFEYDW